MKVIISCFSIFENTGFQGREGRGQGFMHNQIWRKQGFNHPMYWRRRQGFIFRKRGVCKSPLFPLSHLHERPGCIDACLDCIQVAPTQWTGAKFKAPRSLHRILVNTNMRLGNNLKTKKMFLFFFVNLGIKLVESKFNSSSIYSVLYLLQK